MVYYSMAKKTIIIFFIEAFCIFLWLFFIGSLRGNNALVGDLNLIDEGQFAAWVSRMHHGELMYKDMHIPYGPLLVYPVYLATKLYMSFFSIRLMLGVIYPFLGICVAMIILRLLKLPHVLYYTTLIFLVLLPGIDIRQWLGILALYVLVYGFQNKSIKTVFFCGMLLAISLLVSTEIGIFVLFISSFFVVVYKMVGKIRNMKLVLALVAGFIIPIASFILWSVSEGWFTNYFSVTYEVLTSVSGVNLQNGQGLPPIPLNQFSLSPLYLLKFLFAKPMLFYISLTLLMLLFSIEIIRFISKKNTQIDTLVFLIICFCLFNYISFIGRSGHYFILIPMIILCLSYFVSLIFPLYLFRKDTISKYISLLIFLLFIFYGLRHAIIFRFTPFFDTSARQNLSSSVSRVSPLAISSSQTKDIAVLQSFFSANSRPTDKIFILDNIAGLYFLLNRENSTRYDLPFIISSKEERLTLIDQLKKNPPKYIIEDATAWAVDDISNRKRLPEVSRYINKNFKKYTVLQGHYIIYKKI